MSVSKQRTVFIHDDDNKVIASKQVRGVASQDFRFAEQDIPGFTDILDEEDRMALASNIRSYDTDTQTVTIHLDMTGSTECLYPHLLMEILVSIRSGLLCNGEKVKVTNFDVLIDFQKESYFVQYLGNYLNFKVKSCDPERQTMTFTKGVDTLTPEFLQLVKKHL